MMSRLVTRMGPLLRAVERCTPGSSTAIIRHNYTGPLAPVFVDGEGDCTVVSPSTSAPTSTSRSPLASNAQSLGSINVNDRSELDSKFESTHFESSEEITVTGRDVSKPFVSFKEYDWPRECQRIVDAYPHPTTIQAQALPIVIEGRDLVAIGQTGSGKTLAFLLPAAIKILKENRPGLRCLVLAPTRELAVQIHSVSKDLPCLQSVVLYGGSRKGEQMMNLQRKKPKLIVSTPGRLIDLVQNDMFRLDEIDYLVLDEADRMLDMGFEPQIRQILEFIGDRNKKERQTLMFSATWPQEIRSLANEFLSDFIHIKVGSEGLAANKNITQLFEFVGTDEEKEKELIKVLKEVPTEEKVIIFTQTKRRADAICWSLQRRLRVKIEATHGDKTQMQRDRILQGFREGQIRVLVATDVAARGLDVNDVSLVVNYDYPNTTEDYVHRIGRTGRNRKGTSVTFMTPDNADQTVDLIKVLVDAEQEVPAQLQKMAELSAMNRGNSRKPNSYRPNNYSRNFNTRGFGGTSRDSGFGGGYNNRGNEFTGGYKSRGSSFGGRGGYNRNQGGDDDEGGYRSGGRSSAWDKRSNNRDNDRDYDRDY